MYETITIEEAQAHLPELIAGLTPGQEIIITSNDQPLPSCDLCLRSGSRDLVPAKGAW